MAGFVALGWVTDVVRTAITVEPRDGKLCVFLPPVPDAEAWCDLIEAVEEVDVVTDGSGGPDSVGSDGQLDTTAQLITVSGDCSGFYQGQMDCWTDPQGELHCPYNEGGVETDCTELEEDPNCGFISVQTGSDASGKLSSRVRTMWASSSAPINSPPHLSQMWPRYRIRLNLPQ